MDFYSLCDAATHLKMYPVFDVIHYTMMCLNVKEDVQKSDGDSIVPFPFSRQHPLALWFSSMLMCFASQIWLALLFNTPLAAVFNNPDSILIASAVWYVVNYTPADIAYKLLSFKLFKLIISCMKEVHRVYGIHAGVILAYKKYPSQYLLQVIAGILKGSSYVWMKPFERFVRGFWAPTSNEFLQPSFVLKGSTVISVLFVLRAAHIIHIEHTIVFSCSIAVLIYLRISMMLLGTRDPFLPFENLICSVIFGGMWDALRRARAEPVNGAITSEAKLKKS
ncbi:trimeric intracellular cation channel type 1B.1-like isoform X1 [Watersipora subatra]|uniref:trimeric intracellular cation channel type 1B.1-like isoform X1 n=1 Tax=Watersipora subatra TaxID=2589382 RepID=UPI00355C5835